MLRYLFDSTAQLRNHLHLAHGHALLFFPAAAAPGQGGQSIVLDVEIPSRGQSALLRGKVHSRVPQAGIWLDFPDAGLLRRLERPEPDLGTRRHRRFGAELMVTLRLQGGEVRQMGTIIDVSSGGARIAGCSAPSGTELSLSLTAPPEGVPRDMGLAVVVRSSGRDTAVAFRRKDPSARAAISALIQCMDNRWRHATTLQHPRLCCGTRGVLEPPLPRVRPRD